MKIQITFLFMLWAGFGFAQTDHVYDERNFLKKTITPCGTKEYFYDDLGNITQIIETAGTALAPPTVEPTTFILCGSSTTPINLTASGSPTGKYNWYKKNGTLLSETGAVLPQTVGFNTDFYVSYTSGGNCESPRVKISIVIVPTLPTPTITVVEGSTTICAGSSLTLQAAANTDIAGLGYLWSTGATTPTIQVSTAGTYKVRYTSGTCQSAEAIIQIQVAQGTNPEIIKDATPNNQNILAILRVKNYNPSNQYQWYKDGQAIAGATQSAYNVLEGGEGIYHVTENNNICTATSASVQVTTVVLALDPELMKALNIYPNPSQDKLTVRLDNYSKIGKIKIQITDLSGKTPKQTLVLEKSNLDFQTELSLNDLSVGSYFLKIEIGNSLAIKRIVKQ